MIGAFLSGIIGYVIRGIEIVLAPIDNAISQNIPQLSSALSKVGDLIDYIINGIGYVRDMTGLSDYAIILICSYLTFALSVPLIIWVIKVAVKWWHALIP